MCQCELHQIERFRLRGRLSGRERWAAKEREAYARGGAPAA